MSVPTVAETAAPNLRETKRAAAAKKAAEKPAEKKDAKVYTYEA